MQCNIQNSVDYCILDQLHFQDITKLDMPFGLLDFAVGDYMHKTPMTTSTPTENMSVEKKPIPVQLSMVKTLAGHMCSRRYCNFHVEFLLIYLNEL